MYCWGEWQNGGMQRQVAKKDRYIANIVTAKQQVIALASITNKHQVSIIVYGFRKFIQPYYY